MSSNLSMSEYRELVAKGSSLRLGGKRRKQSSNTQEEEALQRACFIWLDLASGTHEILSYAFHPANGGKRSKGEAGKLKAVNHPPLKPLACSVGLWKRKPKQAWLTRLSAEHRATFYRGTRPTLECFLSSNLSKRQKQTRCGCHETVCRRGRKTLKPL